MRFARTSRTCKWRGPRMEPQGTSLLLSTLPTSVITIGNSRITSHHFISGNYFSQLFHPGLHQNILAELFLVISQIYISCLTPTTYVIITSENCGRIHFRKDFMCITSKYSRAINFVILAVRMVGHLRPFWQDLPSFITFGN